MLKRLHRTNRTILFICFLTTTLLGYGTPAKGICNPDPYDPILGYALTFVNSTININCAPESPLPADPDPHLEWTAYYLASRSYYDPRYGYNRNKYWAPYLYWSGDAINSTILIGAGSNVTDVIIGPAGNGGNDIYNSDAIRTLRAYGLDNYVMNTGSAVMIEGGQGSTLENEGVIGAYDKNIWMWRDDPSFTKELVTISYSSAGYGMRALAGSEIFNRGVIKMNSDGHTGIAIADNSTAINESAGAIDVFGIDSTGMYGEGDNIGVILRNHGAINTHGDVSEGMNVLGDAIMENSGTINAGGDGSRGMVLTGHAGQIENSGSIIANGTGNEGISATLGPVGASYLTTISITNNGLISTSGDLSEGINAGGYDGGSIVNNGTVDVTGTNAEGIRYSGSNASILNGSTGTVTVNGNGVYGISLDGSGQITNDGAVSTTGFSSAGIAAIGGAALVQNSITGSVNVAGDSSAGMGIYGLGDMFNDNTVTVTGNDSAGLYVQGSGTITNSGSVAVYGSASGAVGGDSDGYIDIISYGTIYAFGLDSAGIFIRGAGSGTGAVTNHGSVLVEGVAGYGIGVMADNATITNQAGSVTVTEVRSTGMAVVGDNATMLNRGTINAGSSSSRGMNLLGNDSVLMSNSATGTITTSGTDGYGMAADGLNHTMENNGAITTSGVGAHGMLLGYSTAVSGGEARNYGTIDTSGDNANGMRGQTFNGVFWNLGDVSTTGSGASGLFAGGSGSSISNGAALGGPGSIKTTGDDSSGIEATGYTATVTNSSFIETGGTNSHGIKVTGDFATVSNRQSIKTTGSSSSGIDVTGDAADISNTGDIASVGHGISVTGDGAAGRLIANAGTITASGPAASGVHLIGDATSFLNLATVEAKGAGGTGLYAEGDGISIDNGGTIKTTGITPFTGVEMKTAASQTSILTNSGGITGPAGSAVLGGAGMDKVVNSGSINGDIDLRDGNDQLILQDASVITGVAYGGADGATPVNISTGGYVGQHTGDTLITEVTGSLSMTGDDFIGFENLVKTGQGVTTIGGTMTVGSEVIVDSGTLHLASGSTLNAFGTNVNPNGALDFTGDAINGDVDNNGRFDVSGPGTRVINGAVINNADMYVTMGADLQVNGPLILNSGRFKATGASVSWAGDFYNSGGYWSDPSDNYFTSLTVSASGYLAGGLGDNFLINGDFLNYSTQNTLWDTVNAYLGFTGSGAHQFHLADWTSPGEYSWGTLELSGGSLTLTGSPVSGLYVNNLILGADSSLDLNGLNLHYTNLTDLGGTYYGGQLLRVADASEVPEPSTALLLAAGLLALLSLRRYGMRSGGRGRAGAFRN